MEKLSSAVETLGKGLQTHIDAAWTSELGWGKHTLEMGLLECDEGPYLLRGHHCAFCCTDIGILAIFMSNPDDPMSQLSRARRREEKYLIRYSTIVDIETKKVTPAETDYMAKTEAKATAATIRESQRITSVLYLRSAGKKSICKITAFESTQLSKYIVANWHSHLVHKAASIPPLISKADVELAEDFLVETVNCLALGDFVKKPRISNKLEALNELSEEVMLDLELKAVCFRSREVFVNLVLLCDACFAAKSGVLSENIKPVTLNIQVEESRVRSTSITVNRSNSISSQLESDPMSRASRDRSNSMQSGNNNSSAPGRRSSGSAASMSKPATLKEAVDSELQKRLQDIAHERLSLVRASLKSILSILVFSDCVDGRSSLFTGISPLDLTSWLNLLTSDCYLRICKCLDCVPVGGSEEEVVKDINAQIELGVNLSRPSHSNLTTSRTGLSYAGSSSPANAMSRNSVSVGESLSTPSKPGSSATGSMGAKESTSVSELLHCKRCFLFR
jgi:hypothetical protein